MAIPAAGRTWRAAPRARRCPPRSFTASPPTPSARTVAMVPWRLPGTGFPERRDERARCSRVHAHAKNGRRLPERRKHENKRERYGIKAESKRREDTETMMSTNPPTKTNHYFRTLVLVAALAMVASLLLTQAGKPAQAAFPGQNGKIAFVSFRDGNEEIYTMNPDGSGQTRLTNNGSFDESPSFSPDGKKI